MEPAAMMGNAKVTKSLSLNQDCLSVMRKGGHFSFGISMMSPGLVPGMKRFSTRPTMKTMMRLMMYNDSAGQKPMKAPTSPRMTTVRAEHGTSVASTLAMKRSRSRSMIRVPRTAGTLHPNPRMMGMKALPCRPIGCMMASVRNAMGARYPEFSRNDRMIENGTI